MKISLEWLSSFVDLKETDPDTIARTITARVAEVDDVVVSGTFLKDVCVGKILTLGRHPNADRLSVCTVETDRGVKKVVCGGTNLKEGMLVAFAHVGARVKHGDEIVTLTKATIRGEESEGMIAAAEELELEKMYPPAKEDGARPVIDFKDAPFAVGAPLRTALADVSDAVIHVDNHAITNRPDLFSHKGFAREFAAMGIGTWKAQDRKPPTFGRKDLPFKFLMENPDLLPRYCSVLLEIDGLGETPAWLKRRIEAVGWRSINLPIDITNYVASELGVPMHSFDADDIKGDIRCREAKAGEKIITLDGVERDLPEGTIVLSDDEGIFDLFGIMGGLRSSTKDTTKRIFLHSASCDPVRIRKAVIGTGHRTDAATVYEKNVPKVMAKEALIRAVELFLAHVPGARIVSKMESFGDDGKATPIELPASRLARLLGVQIPDEEVKRILEALGFNVKSKKAKNDTVFTVTPPLTRLNDIRNDQDLVEEVGRIYGYDAIEAVLPSAKIAPPQRDQRLHRLRDGLKEAGYVETLPLSLVGSALIEKADMNDSFAVAVENPISEDLRLVQTSTLPSLLEHAQRNILQAGAVLRTFHCSNVFEKGPKGRMELSVLLADIEGESEKSLKHDPFLQLKQDLLDALHGTGYVAEILPENNPPSYAHPGRSADIRIDGQRLGRLFEVHPSVRSRFDLPHRAAAVILNVSELLDIPTRSTVPVPVPAFPSVAYDVTMTRTHQLPVEPLLKKAEQEVELLESVKVVDLYTGKPLKDGEYNLTLRFTYRAPDKTLTETEAQKAHAAAMQVFE